MNQPNNTTEADGAPTSDWDNAMSVVHDLHGTVWDREIEYAREWSDRVEVDYDEGPCAIGFVKGGGTFWFLIDHDSGCEWDADDPRSEMILALLDERDQARRIAAERYEECEELRAHYGEPALPTVLPIQQLKAERDSALSACAGMEKEVERLRAERDTAYALSMAALGAIDDWSDCERKAQHRLTIDALKQLFETLTTTTKKAGES